IKGNFSAASILNCGAFHNDYFQIKSPVWNSVPMTFLFDRARMNPDHVVKLLLEPKCFNPFADAPNGWFLWPWQQSLRRVEEPEILRYTPIPTTSLVFDLR